MRQFLFLVLRPTNVEAVPYRCFLMRSVELECHLLDALGFPLIFDFFLYGDVTVELGHSDLFGELMLLNCAGGGWLSIIEFIGKECLNFNPNIHLFSIWFLLAYYYMMCVITWEVFCFAIFT